MAESDPTSDPSTMTTDEPFSYPYYFPPSTHVIVGSYLVVIGLLGTVGNGLVLAMFLKFRGLITPTSLLLINLAVSDLGLIVLGFPFSASSSFAGRWLFGEGGCQWYAFMGFLFGSAHIGTLALLALDRYLIACRISLRGKLTYRRYCQMLSAIWGYAFFWAAMPLLGWGRYGMEPSVTTCTIDWQHNDSNYKSFILVYFVLGFMVPLAIITVCYFAIARRIRKNTVTKQRGVVHDQWTNERSITLMSFVLILTFIIAWTPYAVLCLWTIFDHPNTVPPFLTLIPPLFAKASTVFNPFIYFFSNPKLRTGIVATLCCCKDVHVESIEMPDSPERVPSNIDAT
ncbi:visual pigment-like receptor peropsin [Argiope bruennichi]|uniref:Visual pigment-like receptor peropsin like protein n=1 Tax=Argiope bruennichi TaxID=94029 RepID=A0A8T0EZ24_ARGBR|nr:visual pigment-like receptor peropsin [Argiope bruennichi]KAF8781582.1 Visual pigment-like receptor peropsin like protein [Argiope bruennichi]